MQTASSHISVAQPDITLLLNLHGVIEKVTLSGAMSDESTDAWVGRPWVDTVADVGGDKVRRMIEDARASGVSAFRQVNQLFPSGLEVPIEYTAVRFGGKGGVIAIGKSLKAVAQLQSRLIAAQQTMERDYWKLREVETRYRLLFDASNEAVVILKANNLRVVEANPAALAALEIDPLKTDKIAGREFLSYLQPRERSGFQSMLDRVRDQGRSPGMSVRLGGAAQPWIVRASPMGAETASVFVLQFAAAGARQQSDPPRDLPDIDGLIERSPDGFVVCDSQGVIQRANRAFLSLAQANSAGSLIGEPLSRWLWQPGADVGALLSNVRKHRDVRLFSTVIHGDFGSDTEVEISAAGDSDGDPNFIALVLRDVSRRLPASVEAERLGAALSSIAEQIGKAPLRKVVQDTVDVVERHHIRAALETADGNRTAAAELLGLSRQSLYAKLNRYGLESDFQQQSGSND